MDNTLPSENQQKTAHLIDSTDRIVSLIYKLENDMNACDFKWTLFVAAANSYKYDSLLKPFPTAFVAEKTLNINYLREVVASVPSFGRLLPILRNIIEQLKPNEKNDITEETIDLLHWCLIKAKEPTLKSVHPSDVSEIS